MHRVFAILVVTLCLSLSPVATRAQCVGDCSGDGMVMINEMVIGVAMSLGTLPPSTCSAFGNPVSIANLILGVNNLLNGCENSATPTPTPGFVAIALGRAGGVPGGGTSIVLDFNSENDFTIGTIELEYSFDGAIMNSIGDCSFDSTFDVNIVTNSAPNRFSVTITPQGATAVISVGERLTCQFQVSASAKAGVYTSSLSGTITLADGQSGTLSSTSQVTLNCVNDDNCETGEVCDDTGSCVPSPAGGVVLFDNANYVDTSNTNEAESDTLQASLTSLGYVFTTFTDESAFGFARVLGPGGVLVIPEQEIACLAPALDDAARTTIRNFVGTGGSLLVMGGILCAGDFLNAVFNFSLSEDQNPGETLRTGAAATTRCADAPSSLPDNDGSSFFTPMNLPIGATPLYVSDRGESVMLIPYGPGTIAFLGWDWYLAAPLGDQDGGWLSVLDCMMQELITRSAAPRARAASPHPASPR